MGSAAETGSALFARDGSAALPGRPALRGAQCLDCGQTVFPLQTYGCEVCGSSRIAGRLLSGRGRLVASATVYMQSLATLPAPYVIGSIITEDGAIVRAILDVPPDSHLKSGTEMVTCLVPQVRPDQGADDIRFVPVEES